MNIIVTNIMAIFMEELPPCTVGKMKDKYWHCGSPGHIHPVLGTRVYHEDNTSTDRDQACPITLQNKLSEKKYIELGSNLYWGCYQEDCFKKRHSNLNTDPICSRCGDGLRGDAYIRLVNEWTHYLGTVLPEKDIFTTGTALEIDEIVEEMLSPHCRPLTGLLFEGWFSNESVQISEIERAPKPTCICADDPKWWSNYDSSEVYSQPGTSQEKPKKD